MGVFGRWSLVPICQPHDRTTPARTHAGTTGADWNHTQHTITSGTTGKEHDGPSYQRSITGHGTTGSATTGIQESHLPFKNIPNANHVAQRPNGLPFSCRERAPKSVSKPHDLAREAVGCMGVFGRWSLVPICCPHDRTTPARNHLARRAPIGTTPSTRSRLAPRARSTTGLRTTAA